MLLSRGGIGTASHLRSTLKASAFHARSPGPPCRTFPDTRTSLRAICLLWILATRSRRSRPVFSTLRRNGYPARSAYAPTRSTIRRRLVHLLPVRSLHSPSMVRPQQVREHSRHPDLIRRCVVEAGTGVAEGSPNGSLAPANPGLVSPSATAGEYALPEDDAGEAAISQQCYPHLHFRRKGWRSESGWACRRDLELPSL